jgi:hypothetical protein
LDGLGEIALARVEIFGLGDDPPQPLGDAPLDGVEDGLTIGLHRQGSSPFVCTGG